MKQQDLKLKKKTLFVFKSIKSDQNFKNFDPTTNTFTVTTTGTSRVIIPVR